MTQIFLIRHGEAEGNLYRRAQGYVDLPLSADGRRQTAALTPRFADIKLDAVCSSDLRRAMAAADAAAGSRSIPRLVDIRFREMGFGVWENRPWGEIDRQWPEQKRLFLTDPERLNVPGMEDCREVVRRFRAGLTELAEAYPGGAVAVGTHGMAIRLFLASLRGVPSAEIRTVTLPGNTGVALLEYENGEFTVRYDNDLSHLPTPPRPTLRAIPGETEQSFDLWFAPYGLTVGKERYIACYEDAWRQAHGNLRGFDATACWLSALQYAEKGSFAVTAGYREDDFAGLITLDARREALRGVGWLAFLYVAPEFRRHGCGRQLLGEAVTRYRALGRKKLRLSVAPGNPALAFYEKLGFVRVGTRPGAVEPLWIMELGL